MRHFSLAINFLTFVLIFCLLLFFLLQSVCSLLHVNKIFEVGMSENLRDNMKYLNLDIVEKVPNNIFDSLSIWSNWHFNEPCVNLCLLQANSCITTELAYVYELVIVSYFPGILFIFLFNRWCFCYNRERNYGLIIIGVMELVRVIIPSLCPLNVHYHDWIFYKLIGLPFMNFCNGPHKIFGFSSWRLLAS